MLRTIHSMYSKIIVHPHEFGMVPERKPCAHQHGNDTIALKKPQTHNNSSAPKNTSSAHTQTLKHPLARTNANSQSNTILFGFGSRTQYTVVQKQVQVPVIQKTYSYQPIQPIVQPAPVKQVVQYSIPVYHKRIQITASAPYPQVINNWIVCTYVCICM